jgi:hypothetical protein
LKNELASSKSATSFNIPRPLSGTLLNLVKEMKRSFLKIMLVIGACSSAGCAMCCGPFDYDYPNFGGRHERADRSYGRVGSVFSDPLANHDGPSADSNLKEAEIRPRGSGNDSSEEADRLRERIEQELERNQPGQPNPPRQERVQPDSDTTEAFNPFQRPRPLGQWR